MPEQPPGLKSLSVNSERGEFRRGHGRGCSGIFCGWKSPRLGWDKGSREGTEGEGSWGCLGHRDQLRAPCRDSRAWFVPNPNFIQGEKLCGCLIPRGAAAGPSPGDIPGLALGQQHQGPFGPNPSSVPAPGSCLGSTGMSFHKNKILQGTHSTQAICWTLRHLKWDFRAPPVRLHPARAAQDGERAAGGAARPQPGPGMPSAVHSSGRRPGARPAPLNQKKTKKAPQTAETTQPAAPDPSDPRLRSLPCHLGPCCDKSREVVSCRIPFPSSSIPAGQG